MNTTPDFRALCAQLLAATQLYTGQNPAASEMSSVEITEKLMDAMAATVAALATAPPEPPKNCWLDDEPDLFPSPCVFDDPDEVINNCTYARTVKCKTDCKYYRVAAHPEPVQAPPPEPPTDDELLKLTENVSTKHLCAHKSLPSDWDFGDYSSSPKGLIDFARAVLERWGK